MFDLTNSSPDGAVYTDSERQESQGHKEPKDTLERGKQGNKAVASLSYYTRSTGRLNRTHCPASKDRNMSSCQASRAESTVNNVAHKVYKVRSSALKRPARYCNNGTDSDDELSLHENTSKRSGSTGLTTANKDKNGTRQKNYGGKTTVTSKVSECLLWSGYKLKESRCSTDEIVCTFRWGIRPTSRCAGEKETQKVFSYFCQTSE